MNASEFSNRMDFFKHAKRLFKEHESQRKTLREVPRPSYSGTQTGRACDYCGWELLRGHVGCPDGIPGCCVIHNGYICPGCDRQFI